MRDLRADPAKFYDLIPTTPDDIPFYVDRLPSVESRVLELGCGTGRVAIPLAAHCRSVHGLDLSEAMIRIGLSKVSAAGLANRVRLEVGDISSFALPQRFNFIIAPFRVFQNLESDAEVEGLLRCIKAHLEPRGRCILNTFRPKRDAEAMRTDWVSDQENLAWEIDTPGGRVACFDKRERIDADRRVLYPELVYRRFEGDDIVEEAVLRIVMRYYYPEELTSLIESHGFKVLGKWGGYAGEAYGEGGELVVEFGVEA